jgi:hypothetical protein
MQGTYWIVPESHELARGPQGMGWTDMLEVLESGMRFREVELGSCDILGVLVGCVGCRGWTERTLDVL